MRFKFARAAIGIDTRPHGLGSESPPPVFSGSSEGSESEEVSDSSERSGTCKGRLDVALGQARVKLPNRCLQSTAMMQAPMHGSVIAFPEQRLTFTDDVFGMNFMNGSLNPCLHP